MYLFELCFSKGTTPVVGLLGHMIVVFLVFLRISRLFSIVAVSIYFPISSARGFPLLPISQGDHSFLSDSITAYFVIFCPCRRGYKIFSSMDASVGSLESSL